jgi:hypothetical protein
VIVEGIGILSLLLAGVALILIEIWGIKKIWHVMNSRRKPSARKRIREAVYSPRVAGGSSESSSGKSP